MAKMRTADPSGQWPESARFDLVGDAEAGKASTLDWGPEGEVVLRTYEQLKNRGGFSGTPVEGASRECLPGKYEETVTEARLRCDDELGNLGIWSKATAKQLKQFQERRPRTASSLSSRCTARHGSSRRSSIGVVTRSL